MFPLHRVTRSIHRSHPVGRTSPRCSANRFIALIGFLLAIASTTSVPALIIVRQDGGGDATTIAAGLALASPGEEVRVTDGPFASMKATVEEINDARGKLRVHLTIFGRPTRVELDFTQVEKLS